MIMIHEWSNIFTSIFPIPKLKYLANILRQDILPKENQTKSKKKKKRIRKDGNEDQPIKWSNQPYKRKP